MEIELLNESNYQEDDLSEDLLVDVAEFAMARMGLHPDCSLSITLVDEQRISELHVEWMDLPGPTDVLSFPMDELSPNDPEPGIVGDLVLCPQFVKAQAADHGVTFTAELALLTIHGVLHCLGYDHAEPTEEREMFALQQEILREWSTK